MANANTVGGIIRQLLPDGSNATPGVPVEGEPRWSNCPEWPADTFAVMATLVEQSDCYTCISANLGDRDGLRRQQKRNAEARSLGQQWAETLGVPLEVKDLWTQLLTHEHEILHHRNSASNGSRSNPRGLLRWERLVLRLLAIADEAGRSFGWAYPARPEPARSETDAIEDGPSAPHGRDANSDWAASRYSSTAARFLVSEFNDRILTPKAQRYLGYLPNSICSLVPPQIACVQPKSNTPQMGCTLRALSHHLALLPGIGAAESEWVINFSNPRLAGGPQDDPGSLNILVIPFPYDVRGSDFEVATTPDADQDGLFTVRQGWLRPAKGKKLSAGQMKDFVVALIDAARSEVRRIDIVVFPELALTNELAAGMARLIERHFQKQDDAAGGGSNLGPDLLICGTSGDTGGENEAMTIVMAQGLVWDLHQSKHHRWRIDGNQIKSYHLGHAFNPKRRYWEKIPLRERHLRFVVNRGHEVIAALVCEDLARSDPVMPLLNAVGPNLVVALLMDGPQLISRWPGRYATVLADDPGSAVLSVTSLGMVRRSRAPDKPMPGDNGRRCVAIWREPDQSAQELDLPPGAHALVLALSSHPNRQVALDLRDDANMGFRLELSAARGIALSKPPAWLERDHSSVT